MALTEFLSPLGAIKDIITAVEIEAATMTNICANMDRPLPLFDLGVVFICITPFS